jgi:hypothetical protein
MLGGLLGKPAKAGGANKVSVLDVTCRRAVDANLSRIARTRKGIAFQTCAAIDVPPMNHPEGLETGCFEEDLLDGRAPLIVTLGRVTRALWIFVLMSLTNSGFPPCTR